MQQVTFKAFGTGHYKPFRLNALLWFPVEKWTYDTGFLVLKID